MDIVKSSADLIVLPEEVVRFQALKPRWEPRRALVCVRERGRDPAISSKRNEEEIQTYDHSSYVESAIVIISCTYCFEGLDLYIRCQKNTIKDAPVTYLFAICSYLILVQCREVLLNCRIGACSVVHKDLQRRKLVVIVRPVIAAKASAKHVTTIWREVG